MDVESANGPWTRWNWNSRLAEIAVARFEDQSGRDGADGESHSCGCTYVPASAFITAAIDAIESGGIDRRIGILLGAGFGLWLCSQSLNNFRRLLPVWLRCAGHAYPTRDF